MTFCPSMNSYRRGLQNGALVNQKLFILEKVNFGQPTKCWSNLVNFVKRVSNLYYLVRVITVGSWEIEKDLLLALVFHVFITNSRLISTSIALHAPLILKKCPFFLEKILYSSLLGNRERPIISTFFACF